MKKINLPYRSNTDAGGAPNCGEFDCHMNEAFNRGLLEASKIYEKEIVKRDKMIQEVLMDLRALLVSASGDFNRGTQRHFILQIEKYDRELK